MEFFFPDRAYAFFSHSCKSQLENMPLLDKVIIIGKVMYNALMQWFSWIIIQVRIHTYLPYLLLNDWNNILFYHVLSHRVSLYDYDITVGENGKILVAFG